MKEDLKNIIKQTVDNHSDDINPDMIWSGIEHKIGQKKKRLSGYWIFGGLSLLAVLLVVTFLWLNPKDSQKSTSINYMARDLNGRAESTDIANDINQKVELEENIKVASGQNEIVNKSPVNDSNLSKQKLDKYVSVAKNLIKVQDENIETKNIIGRAVETQSKGSDNVLSQQSYSNKSESGIGIVEGGAFSGLETNEGFETINIKKLGSKEVFLFPLFEREIISLKAENIVYEFGSSNDVEKVNFINGIELYSGLYFGTKSINDVDQSYAQLRNESEELLEQWNIGLRLNLVSILDFNITSGLKYSMITDRMLKVDSYEDLAEYTLVTSRLVDDNIELIESVNVVDSIPQNREFVTEQFNSQRLVSIPLELSFGKKINKFNIGLGFGIDLNYQLEDTHVILNKEGKAVINNVGGKWTDPSFSGAFLMGYDLNQNWSVTSRINFRGLTFNDHESISTLNTKYALYGVELGLKRSFGN